MDLTSAAAYVASTFGFVLAAGFQSRNVNAGRYVSSIIGTLGISTMQLVTVRTIATGDPLTVWLLTVLGAVPGILLAIWLSKRIYKAKRPS